MKITPKRIKFLLNIYGPFVGSCIRIESIKDDWREVIVSMKMRWYNRNVFGVHFGGSLYSMVDPHYVMMLHQILGKEYFVWDKSADIDYVKPGKGKVTAHFSISDSLIDEIKYKTATGEKYLPSFNIKVIDQNHDIVANVNKTIYIKKKPKTY